MTQKTYLTVSGTIFGVVALLHLARLLAGWPVHIGAFEVSTWLSWVAMLVAAFLSLIAFRLQRRP